jgi:chorismate mutase
MRLDSLSVKRRKMKMNQIGNAARTLGIATLLACCVVRTMAAGTNDSLEDLVDAAAYRLSLADQVALTKWDSKKAVEDPPRERIVIDNAMKQAASRGLSTVRIADVFADQIEANKLLQYQLLAQWERTGSAPTDHRPNLERDIRPKLDVLQSRLIDGLVRTSDLPTRSDCGQVVAVTVGAYASSKQLDTLHAIALDRATARICEK